MKADGAAPRPAPRIWEYSDYRLYLSDFIAHKRAAHAGFTVRKFCLSARISTQNYVLKVIRGEKNLGPKLSEQFITALGLQNAEAEYFRELAKLGFTRNLEDKNASLGKLSALRRRFARSAPVVDHSVLRHWYLVAIWELASCADADMSPPKVAQALRFKVSQQEIKEAIEYLSSRGYLIERNGRLVQSDVPILFKSGKTDEWIRLNHRETVGLAVQAVDWPIEERGFFGLTIAVTQTRLPELKTRISAFMGELQKDFALDPSADTVYRVNSHAYPLASLPKKP